MGLDNDAYLANKKEINRQMSKQEKMKEQLMQPVLINHVKLQRDNNQKKLVFSRNLTKNIQTYQKKKGQHQQRDEMAYNTMRFTDEFSNSDLYS